MHIPLLWLCMALTISYLVYLHFHPNVPNESKLNEAKREFIQHMIILGYSKADIDIILLDYTCTSDFVQANKKLNKTFKKRKWAS